MIEQGILDLAGEDLESAHRDHVLAAIDDLDETIGIDRCDVTGPQPAILGEGVLCGIGPVPVTAHDLRTAHHKLARFAIGRRSRGVLLVDQLHLSCRNWLSDRADAFLGFVGIGRDHTRTFGQAVSFEQAGAAAQFEPLLELRAKRGTTRNTGAQR